MCFTFIAVFRKISLVLTPRPFWVDRIEALWRSRSIVWLAGARRLGKTVLGRQVPEARVFNCDLPSVRERLADPELFYASLAADCRIVLDEVHRADDPSGLLKIGADEHPGVRILATGSSTLHASARFRDSLAGRKWPVRLFAVATGRDRVAAVEAKVSPQAFDARSLRAFRAAYPQGPNLLCCPLVAEPYPKRFAELTVTVCAPFHAGSLIEA